MERARSRRWLLALFGTAVTMLVALASVQNVGADHEPGHTTGPQNCEPGDTRPVCNPNDCPGGQTQNCDVAQTDQTGGCNVHATVHNPHCAEGSANPPPPDGDDDDDDGGTGPGVVDEPDGGDAVDAGRAVSQGQPVTSEVGGVFAGTPRVESGDSGVTPAGAVSVAGIGMLVALVAMTAAGGVMAYRRVR
jgi:hypothetical protein